MWIALVLHMEAEHLCWKEEGKMMMMLRSCLMYGGKGNLFGSKLGAAGPGRAGRACSQTWTSRSFSFLSGQWAQDVMLFTSQPSAWMMMMVKAVVWNPEIRGVAAVRGTCRAVVTKIGTWRVNQKSWLCIFTSQRWVAKLLLVTSTKVPTDPFNPSLSESHTTTVSCKLPVLYTN